MTRLYHILPAADRDLDNQAAYLATEASLERHCHPSISLLSINFLRELQPVPPQITLHASNGRSRGAEDQSREDKERWRRPAAVECAVQCRGDPGAYGRATARAVFVRPRRGR